jgi:phosphoribosylformylglycinamidine synthase
MTLALAAMGRVPDVKDVVTKDFKRAGNKLVLLGAARPDGLCGSVYADTFGQRGDRLFNPGNAAAVQSVWDTVLAMHAEDLYVSGSAIAEGGLLLRLFEAAFGSGLGARIELSPEIFGRRDELLFGEFIGSVLLEVSPDVEQDLEGLFIPHLTIGEVIAEPQLVLAEDGGVQWQQNVAELEEVWSKTFREVVE